MVMIIRRTAEMGLLPAIVAVCFSSYLVFGGGLRGSLESCFFLPFLVRCCYRSSWHITCTYGCFSECTEDRQKLERRPVRVA